MAAASGSGPRRVLPVFEAMLRASDAAPGGRRSGSGRRIGEPEATAALLAGVLHQRGESVRAAAAEALASHCPAPNPKVAGPYLEQAISGSGP